MFEKLDMPTHWKEDFTKYPNGSALYESVCRWVQEANNAIDAFNNERANIEDVRVELNELIAAVNQTVADTLQDQTDMLQLVTLYDPRIDVVEASLAQKTLEFDAVVANVTVDTEVILARRGAATLGAKIDEVTSELAAIEAGKLSVISPNYFNRDTATAGFYSTSLNFYNNGTTSFSSQKVPVTVGDFLKIDFRPIGTNNIQFFDEYENIIHVAAFATTVTNESYYLPISDIRYKFVSVGFTKSLSSADNDTLKSIQKLISSKSLKILTGEGYFVDKNYNALGDSITQGYLGSANGGYMLRPYPLIVRELVGFLNSRNYGVSGTCIASGYGAKPSEGMVDRFQLMDNAAHVISVLGGVNDRDANVPLGTFDQTSTNKTTFYGALNVLVKGLITKYPNKVIFLMTPLSRGLDTANTAGHKLSDYAQAIRVVGAYYALPVLDLHANSNFFPYNSANNAANSMDGLHPNQAYVENILSRKIAGFIKTNA